MNKICQSCSMPLKNDPKKGGSNKDGSISLLYCSYCYKDGDFTKPDMDVKEMRKFCFSKMNELGLPKIFAWVLSRRIPFLKRWR